MKPRAMCKTTSSGIEVWRVRRDEEGGGVAFDFTIPDCGEYVCESWSIEPDPKSKALTAYVARKIALLRQAGYTDATAAQFDRAVAKRAERTFVDKYDNDYEPGPAAAKRSKEEIRYLEKNPDGYIRFVDERGKIPQWWCLSFDSESTLVLTFTEASSAQIVRTTSHLHDGPPKLLLAELHTEYCMSAIDAIQSAGYRYASATQFANVQAKRIARLG